MTAVKTILQEPQKTGDTYADLGLLCTLAAGIRAKSAVTHPHGCVRHKPRWQAGLPPVSNRPVTLISLATAPVATAGVAMTQPNPDPPVPRPRRQKPPRGPLLALLALLALVGGLGAYYLASRPTLVFTNRLAGPVRLAVDSGTSQIIPPREARRVRVPRGKTLVAVWELVRPLSADGRAMGEEVRGSAVVPGARGTIQRGAAPRSPQGDYFAPLITNASDDLLRVRVNAGLEGAVDCGCAVRPGAKRVFIGYYRLYRNSTVQARTSDGRQALFRDLGLSVTSPDGTVGLRFESKDLALQESAR